MRKKLAAQRPAGVELEKGSCRYFRNRELLQKYRDANLTAGHYRAWGRYDSGKPLNEDLIAHFATSLIFGALDPRPLDPFA
jgi:hypothetical protein